MSVADMLDDPFFYSVVTRRRFSSPGTLDTTSGYLGAMAYKDTSVAISLQRPSGKQLALFPEGQRADEALIGYSKADFRTADVPSQAQADQLIHCGVAYEVQSVSPWQQGGYLKLTATKVGQ